MPYRLLSDESLSNGVKRIVQEQAERAVGELTSSDLDRGERVHQARKRFKKIRAVLRLSRDELGDFYSSENRCFRDLGRKLSSVRDAQAVLEAFDALMDYWQGQVETGAFTPLREYLDRQRVAAESESGDLDERVEEVLRALEDAEPRIDSWPLEEESFAGIAGGLKRTYKRGRRAMATAYGEPETANFHEWRKRVKYHRYHVRLLRCLWPQIMKPLRVELKRLSDLLGDDHDLAVLRSTLADAEFKDGDTKQARQALFGLIERRQEQLRAEARPLGMRIFAEKPKHRACRFGKYWSAWSTESSRDIQKLLSAA